MSTTTFIEARFVEATSADPYVREMHRRAMRILNDPTLDRQQREMHVRSIQNALKAHLVQAGSNERRAEDKKARRAKTESAHRNQGVAHPSQVVARRKELGAVRPDTPEVVPELEAPKVAQAIGAIASMTTVPVVASNDSVLTGRRRSVLALKRA